VDTLLRPHDGLQLNLRIAYWRATVLNISKDILCAQ
jgi:hypothetical protein